MKTVTITNEALLSVEENEHIDNVFFVSYDGQQVSPFLSEEDAYLSKAIFSDSVNGGVTRTLSVVEYTHRIPLNSEVKHCHTVVVGRDSYIFAYTMDNKVCDVFQYDARDFKIADSELNATCRHLVDVVSLCMKKYTKWMEKAV